MERLNFKQVLMSLLVLAILSTVFLPLIRKEQASSDVQKAFAKAQVMSQAALLYAQDHDDRVPRLDNNGSCLYGQSPCNTPDWGDLRFPSDNRTRLEEGKSTMFFGALRWYLNANGYVLKPDAKMGYTRWNKINQNLPSIGLTLPAIVNPNEDYAYFDWVLSQMAVNILAVDYGSSSATSVNNRPGAVKGNLSAIQAPENKVLMTMESAWDWNLAIAYSLGQMGVWPSYPLNNQCWSYNSEGFTFYVLEGQRAIASPQDPDRITNNQNFRGKAMFVFADGHVEPMPYLESEQCITVPNGGTWTYRLNQSSNYYYPKWVPEIQ